MKMSDLTAMIRLPNKSAAMSKKPTRVPKLALIDDSGMIQTFVLSDFASSHEVKTYWRIPEDLTELDQFDVLIVDGAGIGNRRFANGVNFLLEYAPKNPDKRFVHFTGLCTAEDRERLKAIGVTVVSKGRCTEELVNAVNGKAKDDGCAA